jgi:hypothetical protein
MHVFTILVLCLSSDQSEFLAVLMVFNLRIGPVFILEFCRWFFSFFKSHFLGMTLGLDLFSGAYLNKFLFLWCPVTVSSSIWGAHQVRWFFKNYRLDEVPKTKIVSLNFNHAVFSFLFTRNDWVMQSLVWLCMFWFRAMWFGVVHFSPLYTNLRSPLTFKHQI